MKGNYIWIAKGQCGQIAVAEKEVVRVESNPGQQFFFTGVSPYTVNIEEFAYAKPDGTQLAATIFQR